MCVMVLFVFNFNCSVFVFCFAKWRTADDGSALRSVQCLDPKHYGVIITLYLVASVLAIPGFLSFVFSYACYLLYLFTQFCIIHTVFLFPT